MEVHDLRSKEGVPVKMRRKIYVNGSQNSGPQNSGSQNSGPQNFGRQEPVEQSSRKPGAIAFQDEMQKKEADFLKVQRAYYAGQCGEQELITDTTQPFFQSMRLSRRRLNEKNLTVDMEIMPDRSNSQTASGGEYYSGPDKDGYDFVGMHRRPVKIQRTYYRNHQVLCRQKSFEIAGTNFLKSDVEGDMAACPNCGHMGKISSYIDGCDACDAKFLVSDFETKVAGYSLEENVGKKTRKTFTRMVGAMVLTSVGMLILGVLAAVILFSLLMKGIDGRQAVNSGFVMMLAFNLYGQLGKAYIFLFWIYLFMFFVLLFLTRSHVAGEEKMKNAIPGFSTKNFLQNLEYKLKNIHLTDIAAEVQPFAHCALNSVVAGYKDVVDCALCHLSIKEVTRTPQGYLADMDVRMRLSCDTGRNIKNKYEKLNLTLSCTEEALAHHKAAIREYKCPGCGGSVDILSGAVCPYCGSDLDYGRFGWVIEKYESRKGQNFYHWIVAAFIAVYVAIVGIGLAVSLGTEDMKEMTGAIMLMNNYEEVINGFVSDIPMPEDTGLSLSLVSSTENEDVREYRYSCENGYEAASVYESLLSGKNYEESYTGGLEYRFYKPVSYAGETGYVKIAVVPEEQALTVMLTLVEAVGE